MPAQLTIAPGTFFTVRVNQVLSSDRNHEGDAFSATLVKPIVVNGVIVADRGQVIEGRVSEAKKAGRVSGTSHLALELTDLTLADGSQVPVKTQLVNRNGTTSVGRDAVGIGAATGVGAIIGAGAGGYHNAGEGAAIGAGAGAAAGIIGVLLTRGHPTIVRPEQVLTFRMDNPIVVDPPALRRPSATRAPTTINHRQISRVPVPPGRYYGAAIMDRLTILIMGTATRITTAPASASASAVSTADASADAGANRLSRTAASWERSVSANPLIPYCSCRVFLPPPPAFRTTPPSSPASAVLPFSHRRKSALA